MQLYIDKRIPQGERIAFCCGFVGAAFTTRLWWTNLFPLWGDCPHVTIQCKQYFNVALVSLLGALRRA